MNDKASILIVDDEEVVRRSHLRSLAVTGCHTEAASDGEEALQVMEQHPFDVVLLDLRMPGLDGMEVLRTLKERWPDSEVVVITGYPTIESAKEAVRLGAHNYIAKPVDVKDVHAVIQECLGGESAALGEAPLPDEAPSLKRLEWEHIHRVLEENEGNISRTAQQLGMHRRTLQRKLKKHAP